MQFKDLQPGNEILILDKDAVTVERASVTQVTPPHVSAQPGVLGMLVGVTVSANKRSGTYELNTDGVVAYANDKSLVIALDASNIIPQLKTIKDNAEKVVSNIDKYKQDIKSCDALIADLDPVFKKEQAYEKRFSKIEEAITAQTESSKEITKLLKKLLDK